MASKLAEHIAKYIQLTEEEVNVVMNYISLQKLKNKEFLLSKGQVCRSLYFVDKGCLRMYINNEKGNEQITDFAIDSWWIADHFSFIDQTASDYYIQATENSNLYALDFQSFKTVLDKVPKMEKYFRIIMQQSVAKAQRRINLLYTLSKEELYFHFASSFPDFVQRVPQYMVASYLNLTPEYVSEIKKKI